MCHGQSQAPRCAVRRLRGGRPQLQAVWFAVFSPLLLVLASPTATPASPDCRRAASAYSLGARFAELGTIDELAGQEPAASMSAAGGLACVFYGPLRRRTVSCSRPSRLGSQDEEDENAVNNVWFVRLWRRCGGWLLMALIALVALPSARAGDRTRSEYRAPGASARRQPQFAANDSRLASRTAFPEADSVRASSRFTAQLQDPRQARLAPSERPGFLAGSAGEPNTGAFDAPDTWRPYWESPNIVVEESDEFPHPRSLDVDNPNRFFYTYRPNIFNIPVPDEWDFYNLINTDRPDFTDAVYSVGKGVTYLETGYTFHKIDDGSTHISTRQLPESLLRYGLTNEFELRLKWNGYLMTDFNDNTQNVHLTEFGSQDIDAAFKWELIQQEGWRPMCTVVSGMLLPSGTSGTSANAVQPHFNLLCGWGFRRWLYLKVQTGCDFLHVSNSPVSTIGSVVPGFIIERSAQASWHQSCCFLTQWTKRVGAFHEWFLIQNTGSGDTRAQNFLDMGAYIYMTPNIQFDARIGKRISNRVDDVFTGVGFSARW